MPVYLYKAKNIKGEEKEGILEAKDKHSLAKSLRDDGYILILAEEEKKKGFKKNPLKNLNPFSKVSLMEKFLFARHLGVMIKAGVSLPRALEILTHQTKSAKFSQVISEVEKKVSQGSSLADSLAEHPNVFNQLFVNMIKVGETSGNLEEVLFILAEQIKKDHELVSKVKGAMIYPGVILSAMLAIGGIMVVFVLPKLVAVFEAFGSELPFTTRLLIGISSFLSQNIFLFVGLVIVLAVVLKIISKRSSGNKFFHSLILKLPLISNLVKKINIARFSRTLGSLISGGVTIIESLNIISGTLTNVNYSNSLEETAKKISKGVELSKALSEYENLYPPLVYQMIAVGEETGTLSDVLLQLAEFYESEVEAVLNNLSSIIEPVLMLLIGGAVGFFAVSIIQPMYSIMGNM